MKYYVYVTNCSEHNHMFTHDTLESAIRQCEFASKNNTCILIKGTQFDWEKKKRKKNKTCGDSKLETDVEW